MSLGILNLQGGNIEQHMTGDIVTANEKNMENWNVVGDVSIAYNVVNTLEYMNIVKPTLEELFEEKGYPVNIDASSTRTLDDIEADMSEHPTWELYAFQSGSGGGYSSYLYLINVTSVTDTSVSYSEGLRYTTAMDATTKELTKIWSGQAVSSGSLTVPARFTDIANYSDISGGGGFEGYIDKNFSVESNSKYVVMFECYTPSGFSATDNNVVLTSGSNTSAITIDSDNTTEYEHYHQFISTDGNTLNVKFDLSTMSSRDGNIEVKVGSIEIYKLG